MLLAVACVVCCCDGLQATAESSGGKGKRPKSKQGGKRGGVMVVPPASEGGVGGAGSGAAEGEGGAGTTDSATSFAAVSALALRGELPDSEDFPQPPGCHNPSCPAPPEAVEDSLSICSRCRMVAYCSVECQRANWKAHKAMCKPVSG